MGMRYISGQVVWKSDDSMSVAINRGASDGVSKGRRFLIYKIGEELFDPVTHKSLGNLEIVCGEGVVKHVQDHISTIQSTEVEVRHKKTIKNQMVNPLLLSQVFKTQAQEIDEPVEIKKPFEGVVIGCPARSIE